ncbi:hypothetical protein GTQ40_09485 [Flavobacteriaceae bacterium R38]|nr:hypothetical protein [Flavobacteriaceae bacterium R38]
MISKLENPETIKGGCTAFVDCGTFGCTLACGGTVDCPPAPSENPGGSECACK